MKLRELSLRPYNGRLFVTFSREEYEAASVTVFEDGTPDILDCNKIEGRFTGGGDRDGYWTYLIFAAKPHTLVHELSHVVLAVFDRCGIDPREAGGEPFCYLLSQLVLDCTHFR